MENIIPKIARKKIEDVLAPYIFEHNGIVYIKDVDNAKKAVNCSGMNRFCSTYVDKNGFKHFVAKTGNLRKEKIIADYAIWDGSPNRISL